MEAKEIIKIPAGAMPSPAHCNCMWTDSYGFVPEADCELHDNEDFIDFVNFIGARGAESMQALIEDNIRSHLADAKKGENEDTRVAKNYVLAIDNVLYMIGNMTSKIE